MVINTSTDISLNRSSLSRFCEIFSECSICLVIMIVDALNVDMVKFKT